MKLYLDLHDTIVNWVPRALVYLHKHLDDQGKDTGNLVSLIEDIRNYPSRVKCICKAAGVKYTPNECFFRNFSQWRNLNYTDWGEKLIEWADVLDPNWTLLSQGRSCDSSRSHAEDASMGLANNKLGLENDRVVFTSAKHKLVSGPDCVLVDDSDKHCNAWTAAGGYAILVPRPWNSQHRAVGCEESVIRRGLKLYHLSLMGDCDTLTVPDEVLRK
jgi:hypothetical protein